MAKVKLGLDDSELRSGLAAAGAKLNAFQQKTVSDFGKVSASLNNAFALAGGIAGVQALGTQVVALLGHFDDIVDGAKKLDMSVESFQRMKLAAELSGASIDGLSGALLKMTAELQRGGAGGEKIQKALANLNIDVAAFVDAKPEEKLRLLTEGFQKARESGKGLSEIQDLFKKQFIDLIPLLTTAAEEMNKISKEKVVSEEDAKRLADANDQLDTFKNRLTVIAGTNLSKLIESWDSITAAIERATGVAISFEGIIGAASKGTLTQLKEVYDTLFNQEPPDAESGPKPTYSTIEDLERAKREADASAPVATPNPQSASSLPGLSAAGVNPEDITTPQVAATNQQSGAASANANRRRYDAATLKALEENNKILATLAAY
jgi:hypothetical protein